MPSFDPPERGFITLCGESRGAYTVRVLAGLLYELGLLPRGNNNLIPYVARLFKTAKKDPDSGVTKAESKYWQVRDAFRETFARAVSVGDQHRRFPVHFIGVWDTVSSVGWVWNPPRFPFSRMLVGLLGAEPSRPPVTRTALALSPWPILVIDLVSNLRLLKPRLLDVSRSSAAIHRRGSHKPSVARALMGHWSIYQSRPAS